jgi:death-on-curing protein
LANTGNLETLTVEDVLRIHDVLVNDFAATGDPIGDMGLRSKELLESAVNRQLASLGPTLKYPEPLGNAATLGFGICCDHPFVNGNKRTALVAILVHLDKNRLCLHATSQSDLYQLMLGIASHTLGVRHDPRRASGLILRRASDDEVSTIKDWLARRTQKVRRGESSVTFRQLRQILTRFDISLDTSRSNTVDVVRTEQVPASFFRRQPKITRKRLGSIGYHNEGTEVSLRDLKNLRRMCGLTESDGVDSSAFYGDSAVVDVFVNRYRTVLRRLAKT